VTPARQYPAFTSFVWFCVVRSLVLFYVAHHAMGLYVWVKWGAYLPQLVLLVMLVLEVGRVLFAPICTLPQGTVAHFIEATTASVGVIVALAIRYPGQQIASWMTVARAMDQATSWVMWTVFGLIAIFASYFGIPWRHRVYGIGVGFFFYLSVDVAVTTVVAQRRLASAAWPIDMLV
jgi:hypothetical protein